MDKEFGSRVAAAGGIEAVVSAMKLHKSEASVQRIACGALLNIAFDPENQTQAAYCRKTLSSDAPGGPVRWNPQYGIGVPSSPGPPSTGGQAGSPLEGPAGWAPRYVQRKRFPTERLAPETLF